MKCGHSANATTDGNKPSCAICAGLTPDALIVDENPPSFMGRMARCSYYGKTPSGRSHEGPRKLGCERGKPCMCEQPSSSNLAFFQHNPSKPHDEFYCGCWGWD